MIGFRTDAAAPTDDFGAVDALILWEASVGELSVNDTLTVAVSVQGSELPADHIPRLQKPDLLIVSSKSACNWQLSTDALQKQSDDKYAMSYSLYTCGVSVQGSLKYATLVRDAAGWHVIEVRSGLSF